MNSPVYRSSRSALVRSGTVLAEAVFQTKVAGLTLESQLLLQAHLDGESGLAEGLNQEPNLQDAAHSLLGELSLVKSLMTQGELQRLVPQSRKCYWHTIQRAISSGPRGSGVKAPGNFPKT